MKADFFKKARSDPKSMEIWDSGVNLGPDMEVQLQPYEPGFVLPACVQVCLPFAATERKGLCSPAPERYLSYHCNGCGHR